MKFNWYIFYPELVHCLQVKTIVCSSYLTEDIIALYLLIFSFHFLHHTKNLYFFIS